MFAGLGIWVNVNNDPTQYLGWFVSMQRNIGYSITYRLNNTYKSRSNDYYNPISARSRTVIFHTDTLKVLRRMSYNMVRIAITGFARRRNNNE